jgi:hypothetical protein
MYEITIPKADVSSEAVAQLISDFVLNAVGIARKTRRVLATAPGLA